VTVATLCVRIADALLAYVLLPL
jgi:hypothetical protein